VTLQARSVVRLAVATLCMPLAMLALTSCNNDCVKLAEAVCERAGNDLDACKAAPATPPIDEPTKAPVDPCDKIRAITASCESLTSEAERANAEDLDACKADLELIRALEKQQE